MSERLVKLGERLNSISFPGGLNGALQASTVKYAADKMAEILLAKVGAEEKLERLAEAETYIRAAGELNGENHKAVKILWAIHAIIKANLEGTPEPTDEELGLTSKCFIATAACGTSQSRDLARLREFREQVLRRTAGGRSLIRLYERASPPVARIIARSKTLRFLVRVLIVKPIGSVACRSVLTRAQASSTQFYEEPRGLGR